MRKPMVTRSFDTMVVDVLTVNVKTQKVGNEIVTLARVINDREKLEKHLRNYFGNDDTRFVAIVSTEIQTRLFGMSEADFLKYSVELDPETRKILEIEEEENEEEETTEA